MWAQSISTNGSTSALISTLTGSTANDQVGSYGVTALGNGNYVDSSLIDLVF